MSRRLRIHPGHGVGPFVLGSTRRELVGAVGAPERVVHGALADVHHEDWAFRDGAIEVRFDDEDGDRASWVVVADPDTRLAGLAPIGMAEREFLAAARRSGIGPIVLVDDFGHGMRDYEWPAASVSFWVSDGAVESVTVMPFYDRAGEVPLWPRDARCGGAPR